MFYGLYVPKGGFIVNLSSKDYYYAACFYKIVAFFLLRTNYKAIDTFPY